MKRWSRIASAGLVAVIISLGVALLLPPGPHKGGWPWGKRTSPAGFVELPCDSSGPLAPADPVYCERSRAWMTPAARAAMLDVARRFVAAHPGSRLVYMDASGPEGHVPFWPHRTHGDGRELDLAVFFQDLQGRALPGPPAPYRFGYGAFEPPRPGDPNPCKGGTHEREKDPPRDRRWRLDEARTRDLTRLLADDPRVRRLFIEPHLKTRLGFGQTAKVRFAGCWAARHDDHIHVEFLPNSSTAP